MDALQKMQELDRKIEEAMKHVKHKIVILSGKGGVGKTTVAVNLARELAKRGYDVGILDADMHGPNVPIMLGIEHESIESDEQGMKPIKVAPHLKAISLALMLDKDVPVVWRGPLKMTAIKQFIGEVNWGNLDVLVIDLPPGTGDEPLSIAQLIKGSHAIIVTTPQNVALLDSRRSVTFARQLNMHLLGIVENMSGFVCPHCNKEINLFKIGGGEQAAQEMGVPFLGRIPLDNQLVIDGDTGVSTVDGTSRAATALKQITDAVESSLQLEN